MLEDLRLFFNLLQGQEQLPYPLDSVQSTEVSANYFDFFEEDPFVELNEVELFSQQQDVSFYTPIYQFNQDTPSFSAAELFSGSSFGARAFFDPFEPFTQTVFSNNIFDKILFSRVLSPRPDPDFDFFGPAPVPEIPLNLSGESTTTTLDTENVFPFSSVSIGGNPLPDEVVVTVTLDSLLKGTLSGGGFVASGPGEYTFTGSVADAITALQSLTFDSTEGLVPFGTVSTTNFTLSVTGGEQTVESTSTTVLSTPALATGGADTATLPFAITTGGVVDMRNGFDHLTLSSLGDNTITVSRSEIITGGSQNDTVTLPASQTLTADLKEGFDILNIANGTTTLTASNIEEIRGAAGNSTLRFQNAVTDMNIDLGAGGNDRVFAHSGTSSFSLEGVELLRAQGGGSQIVTLLNNVVGLDVSLGSGGGDVLNLAAGANTLKVSGSTETVNGTTSNDILSLAASLSNPTINLGDGVDLLNIVGGTTRITALGIESVAGDSSNNTFRLNNAVSGIDVDLGGGTDTFRFANGTNSATLENVEKVQGGNGNDSITFQNVLAATDSINMRGGTDTVFLASLDHTVTLSGLRNTEILKTGSGADYDLTLVNANVGSGRTLTVDGTALGAANTLSLDGSGESNGFLTLLGGAGADTLIGGGRDDFIKGGLGADILTGNGGDDTFDYDLLLSGTSDLIKDFTQGGGGDILDIANLLEDETTYNGGLGGPLADFVQFVDNGGDSNVQIDADGGGGSSTWVTITTLEGGAGANLADMIGNGNLDVTV